MNENRIIGPGYYPRRPGAPWHKIPGHPWGLVLTDENGAPAGSLPWLGAGRYEHVSSKYPDRSVVHWAVVDVNQHPLYEMACPKQSTVGLILYLDNPDPDARFYKDSIIEHWVFTPQNG